MRCWLVYVNVGIARRSTTGKREGATMLPPILNNINSDILTLYTNPGGGRSVATRPTRGRYAEIGVKSGQIDREETKIAWIGGVRSWRLARRQNGANKVRDRPSNCQTQRTMEHGTRCGWGGGSRRLCIRQRPFIRYSTRQTATQTLLEIIRVWKYA